MSPAELFVIAQSTRKKVLEMIFKSKSIHLGPCFSIVDILTVLYQTTLAINSPDDPGRDIFMLSKGHAAAALYAALAERHFFSEQLLETYCVDGSMLAGHVIRNCLSGVESTGGSLGHGLPMLAGFALANRHNQRRFYALLGDGECNEGTVWEAANFCNQFKLSNVTVIIDANKQQGLGYTVDIMEMRNLVERWSACGWEAIEVDGHDFEALQKVFSYSRSVRSTTKPLAIVAHTIKGKGVSWMEDNIDWHYKSPTPEQFANAMAELSHTV